MRRLISAIVFLVFFIWILPLGVFIKPSQEEKACNGRRAICLCSHLIAKQKGAHVAKIMLTNPGVNKEGSPSGGAGHDYLVEATPFKSRLTAAEHFFLNAIPTQSTFSRNIDHVPKA